MADSVYIYICIYVVRLLVWIINYMHCTYTKKLGVVLKYWYVLNSGYKAQSLEGCRMTLDNRDSGPQEKQMNDACNSHRSQIIYTF